MPEWPEAMTDQKINLLLVDDREENLLALAGILDSPELNLVKTTSGQQALEALLAYDFALILLDVQMPNMDGFETAELIRGREKTKQIPIIFLTAISKEDQYLFRGYESGAVDYLFKPVDAKILRSKVTVFLALYQQKRQIELLNEQLKRLSITDGITEIYNHRYFQDQLQVEIERAHRHRHPVVLLIIDVDHFKEINDAHGHPLGDNVLAGIAALFKSATRKIDTAARYGGDEFALILSNTDKQGGLKLAERIRKQIESLTLALPDQQGSVSVTISVGLAGFPSDAQTHIELIKAADKALYVAKKLGRNRVSAA